MIDVHTSELGRFAESVRFEAASVLGPAIGRLALPLHDGAVFGAAVESAVVREARERYTECVRVSLRNVSAFIQAGEGLAAAAARIAADLAAADGRSAEIVRGAR